MEGAPLLTPTRQEPSEPRSIVHNRHFMFLWSAQAISMTAQQAIWFGMMVVVEEVSRSTTQLSIAVLTTIIPAIMLGLLAGVFVDRVNKKTVLVTTNLLRAVTVLGYLLYSWSLLAVYAVNFLFVAISQFFGPAEASTIPALVPRKHLVAANSAFNITFTASQLVGIVVLAPWVIKLLGAPTLFVVTAVLYVAAGILTYMLPPAVPPNRSLATLRRETLKNEVRRDLSEAWGFISTDARTWWAMIHITLTSCLMLILGMLAPRYVVAVLHIRPEDAVYVLAPAFLGIVGVTSLLSRLVHRFGTTRIVNAGLVATGLAVLGMALLETAEGLILPGVWAILGWLIHLPFRHGLVPPLMVIALILGIGYAMASVPSQAVLMERAPVESRGRIFSVLLLLTNVAAIVPLVFLGGLADALGINVTVGLVAAIVLYTAVASLRAARRERSAEQTAPLDLPPQR